MKRIATFTVLIISALIAAAIVYSYFQTEQKNQALKENIQKVQEELKKPPPPPIIVKKTIIIDPPPLQQRETDGAAAKKKGRSHESSLPMATPIPQPAPPRTMTITTVDNSPIEEYKKNQQIHIELLGILKLQINENNSWETILKILILILTSYGGIKYINRKFA